MGGRLVYLNGYRDGTPQDSAAGNLREAMLRVVFGVGRK
jgi:hypothetical protein